jgi:ParB-like chromosome segregation protein Spo0J
MEIDNGPSSENPESPRELPFKKILLSQSNVWRIKAGVSIEDLAEDIARRTLLQSLTVRREGDETGTFEILAGRRYRALELLVKQKRLAKTAPIPCVERKGGIAEEDSLAENVWRTPLTRSTSSGPSWHCAKEGSPARKSPPLLPRLYLS